MRSKKLPGYNLSIPRFVFFLFLATIIFCSSDHQYSQQADSSVSETVNNVPVDTALVGKIRWVSEEDEFVLLDSAGKELVRIPQRYFADKPRMINDLVYFYHDKNTDFVMRDIDGQEIRRDGGVTYFPVENSPLYLGISNGNKMGLLDTKGRKVLDIQYEDIRLMHDPSSFWVREEGKYYLVRNGKKCSDSYQYGRLAGQDYIWASRNGQTYGFLDTKGEEITPQIYDGAIQVNRFSEGLAPVILDGKLGFIDTTGTLVIPHRYRAEFNHPELGGITNYFNDGRCKVHSMAGKELYINSSGTELPN